MHFLVYPYFCKQYISADISQSSASVKDLNSIAHLWNTLFLYLSSVLIEKLS